MTSMRREPAHLAVEALVLLLAAVALFSVASTTVLRGETQPGFVSGRVYGFACHDNVIPLAGATVAAIQIETGQTPQALATALDGSYNLTVPPGKYALYVAAAFFQTQSSYSFTVDSGASISEFNFYLYPVTSVNCPAVMYQGNLYTLAMYSNASSNKVVFDLNRRLVNFTINGESVSDFLVVVPRILLDGTPVVFVDNVEAKSSFVEGATYYFVQFEQPLGLHVVTVGGYMTIPEFASTYLLAVTASCLALAALLKKRQQPSSVRNFAKIEQCNMAEPD